jgi:hypothetical protein
MLNFTPYAQGHAHAHGLDTTSGYVVRRTFFDADTVHEDAGTFTGDGAYLAALDRVREVRREGHDGYAVIDTLYACGCRGQA